MASGFDTYGGIAGGIADQYGIPQPIFFGLIQQESNWNPTAVGDNGAAYGFGQLHAGAASDMGVNRFDPVGNLTGAASYLSSMFKKFGNWGDALAGYNQGAGNYSNAAGQSYASSVMQKAQGYLAQGASLLGLNPSEGAALGAVAGAFFGGGGAASQDTCGLNPFCYLRQWISSTGFFPRITIVFVGFILLFAAFLLMGRSEIMPSLKG